MLNAGHKIEAADARNPALAASYDEILLLAARTATLDCVEPVLSHDVRGPINTLVLQMELLRHAVAPHSGVDPEIVQGFQLLERALAKFQARFDTLSRWIRCPEAQPSPYSLHDRLLECATMLQPLAERVGVAVEVDLDGRHALVDVPREHLLQALLLLAIAALRTLRNGDRLVLHLRPGAAEHRVEMRGIRAVRSTPGPSEPLEGARGPFGVSDETRVALAQSLIASFGGAVALESGSEGARTRLDVPSAPAP